jgi:hypothetical protein
MPLDTFSIASDASREVLVPAERIPPALSPGLVSELWPEPLAALLSVIPHPVRVVSARGTASTSALMVIFMWGDFSYFTCAQ